ncbi:hypothetical protein HanPI659440_Chr15g0604241 [Helianthus annuus]|nr:hypothetical protein HanPI659440_Chr15g0604241 [Helianthus annuus]
MAPLNIQPFTKVLFLFVLFALLLVPSSSSLKPTIQLVSRRNLLENNHVQEYSDGVQQSAKKKQGTTTIALGTTTQSKNKTKLIKPTTTTTSNSTKTLKLQDKTNLKKLNSTSKPTSKTSTLSSKSTKSTNSTKPTSKTPTLSSKSTNSTKPTSKSPNNTKPTSKTTNPTKPTSTLTQKSKDPTKKNKPTIEKKSTKPLTFVQKEEQEEEDDLISEFKDLPTRFQETLIPDLEVISTTSKSYLNNANKQISKQFKPIVGKKYAPIVASIISFAFIIIPFLLVTLIFNQIKAYFSLQKIIIFIQIYLSIYFSILALSSLVTGLEPLKFFYNTSQSTYVCIQLLQTLAYVLYLLLVLMYFVLVFSTETGVGSRLLGLGQMFVGFAVGLHCYMTVFHRAVLRQPPKTSWKVHSVYATCFLLICLLATLERRKKAYVVDGCEEEKKN